MAHEPTIFIVDDDEAVRDSLQLLLQAAGFPQIGVYASSLRFLDAAKPQPGDCLLLDVRMPDMDGLELQAELNRRAVACRSSS
jgi:two-component system response regulator FixJ